MRIRIFSHSFLNNYFIFGFVAFAKTRAVSGSASARIEVIFTQQGLIEGNFKLYQIEMNVEHIIIKLRKRVFFSIFFYLTWAFFRCRHFYSCVAAEPSQVDMLILGKFWFYFPNLGLVDKDCVIRLRIIGLQVSRVKTPEITLHFIMKLDFLFYWKSSVI